MNFSALNDNRITGMHGIHLILDVIGKFAFQHIGNLGMRMTVIRAHGAIVKIHQDGHQLVIIGHDFPFFLNFKGGKGIAVTSGYIIAMHWSFVIVGLLAFLIPFNITHFVSLGSLCLYTCFFIQLVITGQMGLLGMDLMSQPLRIEMYVIALIMTVLAFYQHRTNIKKLLSGNERTTSS